MKPKKIVSFGDSFVFGSELPKNPDGRRAWPGLVACDLGCDYETLAQPGCGNDAIARQIYHYFANNDTSDVLAIVNWTWFMRWDFYIARNHETWITLGPTCVPQKLQHLVDKTQAHQIVDFYASFANDSILWNKMRNLQTIFAAQQYLSIRGITNIQTYMDPHTVDVKWHIPDYVCELQSLIVPNLQTWDGMTFLDWCRSLDFEITDPGLHPLEEAHEAAAKFWRLRYAQALA
jgi:hypothetical protein